MNTIGHYGISGSFNVILLFYKSVVGNLNSLIISSLRKDILLFCIQVL